MSILPEASRDRTWTALWRSSVLARSIVTEIEDTTSSSELPGGWSKRVIMSVVESAREG
jgi:hypothetical protein